MAQRPITNWLKRSAAETVDGNGKALHVQCKSAKQVHLALPPCRRSCLTGVQMVMRIEDRHACGRRERQHSLVLLTKATTMLGVQVHEGTAVRAQVVSHVEVLTPGERAALAGKPVPVGPEAGASTPARPDAAAAREPAEPGATAAHEPAGDAAAGAAAADAAEGEAPALTTEQEFQVAANRCAAYYLLLPGRAGQEGALLLSGSRHSWPVRWNLYARDAV